MLWRAKSKQIDWYAPVDKELFERVREVVAAGAGPLAAEGRVVVEEKAAILDDRFHGSIEITPVAEGSSRLSFSVGFDTITIEVGGAGAGQEIWTSAEEDWREHLAQVVACVRDGRYSERVRRGRLLPLRVEMQFQGVPSGSGRRRSNDWNPTYGSTLSSIDGKLPTPEFGDFSYRPW